MESPGVVYEHARDDEAHPTGGVFNAEDGKAAELCGGRRMASRAAWLVDRVIPNVPIRQWVLTVPSGEGGSLRQGRAP